MKMIKYIIPLFIILLSACQFEKSKVADKNSEIDSTKFYFNKYLEMLDNHQIYYPEPFKYFIQKPNSNIKDFKTPFIKQLKEAVEDFKYRENYRDSFYKSINEPDIKKIIQPEETIFRFIYSPSREYYRYTFRISKLLNLKTQKHNYTLVVKRFNNLTFIDLNKDTAIITFEKTITEVEFNKFIELVDKSLFWSLGWDDREGFDGSTWSLTGAIRNSSKIKYHRFSIWAPQDGCFKNACKYLIKLYGKDIGPIY